MVEKAEQLLEAFAAVAQGLAEASGGAVVSVDLDAAVVALGRGPWLAATVTLDGPNVTRRWRQKASAVVGEVQARAAQARNTEILSRLLAESGLVRLPVVEHDPDGREAYRYVGEVGVDSAAYLLPNLRDLGASGTRGAAHTTARGVVVAPLTVTVPCALLRA